MQPFGHRIGDGTERGRWQGCEATADRSCEPSGVGLALVGAEEGGPEGERDVALARGIGESCKRTGGLFLGEANEWTALDVVEQV